MRQKGFVLLPVIVFVVLVGVLGYFIYQNAQLRNNNGNSASPTPNNTILLTPGPKKESPTPTISTPSDVVTGEVIIYSITDKTMTVQFIAESARGNITQMMVWTDSNLAKKWQQFSTLLVLPISENVYVKYRDDLNNESQIYSDTTIPKNGPPTL